MCSGKREFATRDKAPNELTDNEKDELSARRHCQQSGKVTIKKAVGCISMPTPVHGEETLEILAHAPRLLMRNAVSASTCADPTHPYITR